MGATGTVGREVVGQLVRIGERPRAFVRDLERARALLGEQVDYVAGDLDRPETIQAALAGVERVFLLTRQSRKQPQWERSVIDAAARAGAHQLVKLSVFRADPDSPLQIARQHSLAEQALAQSGLAHTILRPVFFMQNLLALVREGRLSSAAGDGRVAMIDARDVAAVAAAALTSGGGNGEIHTLTGPEALSFDEVATILSQQTGARIRHVRVSPEALRAASVRAGLEAWFADDLAKLHTMLAAGYEDIVTDSVLAVTGEPPRTRARFAADHGAFERLSSISVKSGADS
jgi:uncharacterized protein YbjT (DUF2867 family)